jgi:hypothetical protein
MVAPLVILGIVAIVCLLIVMNSGEKTKDRCTELRKKHPEWFGPQQVRWSSLRPHELGIINNSYSTLANSASDTNLYEMGYLWNCSVSTNSSNWRDKPTADYDYAKDGDKFLGMGSEDPQRYTNLARAFKAGYHDAANDRGIMKPSSGDGVDHVTDAVEEDLYLGAMGS